MKPIKRVYVAGALTPTGVYSKNPAIEYLINRREMIKFGVKVLFAGFDPFVPALDSALWGVLQNGEVITEPMIKRYSKSWLEVCDAVLLMPSWRTSLGTLGEIKRAEELGIPIFESLEELIKATEGGVDDRA